MLAWLRASGEPAGWGRRDCMGSWWWHELQSFGPVYACEAKVERVAVVGTGVDKALTKDWDGMGVKEGQSWLMFCRWKYVVGVMLLMWDWSDGVLLGMTPRLLTWEEGRTETWSTIHFNKLYYTGWELCRCFYYSFAGRYMFVPVRSKDKFTIYRVWCVKGPIVKLRQQYDVSVWDSLCDKQDLCSQRELLSQPYLLVEDFRQIISCLKIRQSSYILSRLSPSHIVNWALAGRLPLICSTAVIIGPLRSQKDTHRVAEPSEIKFPL